MVECFVIVQQGKVEPSWDAVDVAFTVFPHFIHIEMELCSNSENLKLMCQQRDSNLINSKHNSIGVTSISLCYVGCGYVVLFQFVLRVLRN